MAEESLKNKTVKGTFWSAIDNIAQYAVSFLVSIVLARLLSPDDYGLIGIVTIFTVICNTLINGGFSTAIIRKKNATDEDYNTAFLVNLGMSVFLYVVLYLSAPYIAIFFNREELVLLTRVSCVSMIIGALAMVQQTRLTKRIDFKTQTKITIIASLLSGIIGISMALFGFGVWSLVAQGLASQMLRTLLLWFFNRWIPKLCFSVDSFRNLFGFGWKLTLSMLLDSIWKELYQVIIGKFYSSAALGQYTRAKQFSDLLSTNLTNVVQRVTYPVLSDIQEDKERLVSAYRRIIKTTMFASAIGMFFMGAISEPLLYCLIGPQWHDATVYLPLICVFGSLYPLHAINLNMLQVQGRSDLFLVLEIVRKFVGTVPLLVGILWGILPMLYVNLLAGIVYYFLNSHYSGKLLGYSSRMQLKDVAPSYTIALIVSLSVYFFKFLPVTNWVILPMQLVIGIAVFFLVCRLMQPQEYEEVKQVILPYINKIKK